MQGYRQNAPASQEEVQCDNLQREVDQCAQTIYFQSAAWVEQIRFSVSTLPLDELPGSESAEKRRFFVRREACHGKTTKLMSALAAMNTVLPIPELPPLTDVASATRFLGRIQQITICSWADMKMEDESGNLFSPFAAGSGPSGRASIGRSASVQQFQMLSEQVDDSQQKLDAVEECVRLQVCKWKREVQRLAGIFEQTMLFEGLAESEAKRRLFVKIQKLDSNVRFMSSAIRSIIATMELSYEGESEDTQDRRFTPCSVQPR